MESTRRTESSPPVTLESRDAAREFFAPPEGAPWRWEDRGEVLAWRDGTTLAFADELELIFRRLEPRRLERFESLVAVLAASRGKLWPFPPAAGGGETERRLDEVRAGLKRIAEWPKTAFSTPAQRAELADAVLSLRAGTGGGAFSARDLLSIWRTDESIRRVFKAGGGPEATTRMLLGLGEGLRGLTLERLRLRHRTGLEELPEDAENEAPAEDLRQWLTVLSDEDGVLGQVARLSRRMLAALRLPARTDSGGETGTGGLADLATRGAPERLLLTELAQDEELFTARLALGEALYRRGEPEAGAADPVPAVLLDTTLRLWGGARPLAAAAALAVGAARQRKEKGERIECAVISQGMPLAADWRTRQGLTAALEALDATLDPLPALRAFAAEDEGGLPAGKGKGARREVFFITHAETATLPGFRAALAELPPLWVVTVDERGGFTLWRRREHRALEAVCRAVISLSGLSPAKAVESSAPALPQPGRLPLFLLQNPPPLLTAPRGRLEWAVPDPVKPGRVPAPPGWVGLTSAGQVARGTSRDRGVAEWSQRHTPGAVLAATRRDDGALLVLTVAGRTSPVVTVTGPSGQERCFAVAEPPAWNLAAMDSYAVCFFDGANVYPRALTDGRALPPLRLPGKALRVFPGLVCECEGGVWARLVWSGARVEMARIPVMDGRLVAAWVEAGSGLLRMLFGDGRISGPGADGGVFSLGFPLGEKPEVSVSPCGGSLLVDDAAGARQEVTLAPRFQTRRGYRSHEIFKRLGGVEEPAGAGVFSQVGAAALDAEERLWLRRREAWFRLEWVKGQGPKWTRADPPGAWVCQGMFLPGKVEEQIPEQQALEHPGGALWLDARGLLHLFAWQPGTPEVTITLTQAPGAVWLSDGARGGRRFFIKPEDPVDPTALDRAERALGEVLAFWRRAAGSGGAGPSPAA